MNAKKFLTLAIALISTGSWFMFVVDNNKHLSSWGPVNVIVVGLVLAAIVGFILAVLPWFGNRQTAPWWLLAISVITVLVSLYGGVFMTEPVEPGARVSASGMPLAATEPQYHEAGYYHSRSGGYFYHFWYSNGYYGSPVYSGNGSGAPGGSFNAPSCSGKNCGLAMVALLVLVLAIIVIIGSLFVPHFWVAGSLIFIILLWMFAIRELLMVDHLEVIEKNDGTYEYGYSDYNRSDY